MIDPYACGVFRVYHICLSYMIISSIIYAYHIWWSIYGPCRVIYRLAKVPKNVTYDSHIGLSGIIIYRIIYDSQESYMLLTVKSIYASGDDIWPIIYGYFLYDSIYDSHIRNLPLWWTTCSTEGNVLWRWRRRFYRPCFCLISVISLMYVRTWYTNK